MSRSRRRGERSAARAVFLLVVVISAACASVVPGTTKVCKPASCTGDNCPQVNCEYGNCSPEGLCVCSSCFSGQSCATYKNDYYPQLTNAHEQVTVAASLVAGDFVFKLSAVDPDTTLTCGGAGKDCPCAQIVYAIESGNTDDLFTIDASTGLISAARALSGYSNHVYKLYVSVVNRAAELSSGVSGGDIVGPKSYGLVTVGVGADSLTEVAHDEDESAGHLRYRRAVPYVNNITFALIKTGVYNSTTTMKVGSKVHFQMQITFPAGTIDLLVELFTPDNDTTVMLLCSPVVSHKGSKITHSGPGVPVLDSLDGSYNYDRAVIDFGNVTCASAASNVNETQIFIEWDAVMIEAAVNNTQYWVSAGAEYNNHDEIWIGQAGFTTFKDNYAAQTQLSQFNLSGPANVRLGTSSTFHVDMYLPAPMTEVTFEAFAPINYTDTVSMCSIIVVGVGRNYRCLQYDKLTYTTYNSDSLKTNERARMYIGSVVNSGSRESPLTPYNDSVISVEFSVFVPINTSLIGTTLWIGAAVEISSDHIWAGEIGVNVQDVLNATALAGVTYTINSSVNAAVRSPFLVELNMTIPAYSDTTYTIAVSTPILNSLPLFKLCTIYISYQGVNVPCIYADRPVYKTNTGVTPYDEVLWNLNRVVNTGQRSTVLDPSANTVQVFIFFHPTNHSSNIVGSVSTITTSVMVGPTAATTFMTNVTIAPQTSNVTNSSSPVVATLFKFGNSTLQVNQSADYRLIVTAFPRTLYYPVTLDITVPYDNGSTIFSICRIELLSVGLNLPCVNQTDVNATIQYYNTASYLGYYRASINLDSVCSIATLPANGTFIASAADKMEFSVIVRVENHPLLVANPVNYVGSALNFTSSVSWQGSQPITVLRTPYMAYVNQTPYITAYRPMNTTFADTPVGSLTIYQVLIKTPPMSVADWTIRADVGTDSDITICSVAVKEYGRSIPCLNLTTPMRSITSTQGRKTAWLDLYKLTNVGNNTLFYDSIFDNNTVVVEIVTQVASTAVIGSMHQVNISVDHGLSGLDYSAIMLLNVSAPATPGLVPDAPLPNTTFSRVAVNDNATTALNVIKGETMILVTEISIPFKSRNDLNITFVTTTSGVISFGSVDVVYIGSNIPCLIKQRFNATINALDATINLGVACHWPVDPSAVINDKIRVEAIVTVMPNTTAALLSTFSITSVLQVNGTNQPPDSLTFTIVSDDFIEYTNPLTANMANIIFNVSNSSISNIFPNDNFTVVIDVIVPANATVFGLVDINVPNDLTSAVMTISQVTLNSVGVNLGNYVNLPVDFPIICESKLNSSQMDHCYINFGKLSNTGHTYRSDKYQYGDNTLRFTVTLRMADASVNDKNYISYMNVGAKLGLPMFFRDLGVQLNRNLNEMPTILFQPALNNTVGRLLTLDVLIYHSNASRAEAFNTTVYFYLTKYVVFKRLVMSSYIGKAPNVTNMTDNEAISIGFDHICFTDVFIVRLELLVIDTTTATGVDMYTNIAMEAKYFTYYRTGHTLVTVAGTPLASDIAYTNFTAAPQRAATCAGVALGMESGAITDCQLSASESPDTAQKAVNARISSTGWSSASRLGNFMRYLEVHFGNLTQVTVVTLQNPAYSSNTFGSYSPLQKFALWYSNDGINWTPGINNFTVIGTLATRTNISIPPMEQMEAAYVRLEIISPAQSPSSAMVALKVEFFGCATGPLPITAPELCNVRDGFQKSTVTAAQFYKRGFLVVPGPPATMYMCDSKPSGDMQCYSSVTGSSSWMALDKLVHNIVGYIPSINQLYALDSSHNAFLLSEDNGLTWVTVSAARFQWATGQTGFVAPVVVPWVAKTDLASAAPSTYVQSTWGANYNGLYSGVGGTPAFAADWSACCDA